MIDFQTLLDLDVATINDSVDRLKEQGDSDAALNYLYFLRDEVNRLIKRNKAAV